jgi:riboflavin synthase
MFTGIIAAVGTVVGADSAPRRHPDGGLAYRLDVNLGKLADGLVLGASVAVNGVCLTVADRRDTIGSFDVVPETWTRTTLRRLRPQTAVNLERSLRAGDPVDGHFVQGHVEGTGSVDRIERARGEWQLWVHTAPGLLSAIIPKGSIALDGTSLTVVDVEPPRFSVALIPTTLESTVLGRRVPGDELNIETDVLARVVLHRLEALLAHRAADQSSPITWDALREGGFVS